MRPITVAIGLATAASANSISTSQTPYAGQIILNGAVATFSINNIATTQNPAGAGNLTLTSTVGSSTGPVLKSRIVDSSPRASAIGSIISGSTLTLLLMKGGPQGITLIPFTLEGFSK